MALAMVWKTKLLFYSKVIASLVFLAAGACKVFPFIHAEAYEYLDDSFTKSFVPIWQRLVFDLIGHKVAPIVFKYMIGNLELAVSVLLWGAGGLPLFASFVGSIIMIGAIVTHLMLKETIALPLCLVILCTVIFLLTLGSLVKPKRHKS